MHKALILASALWITNFAVSQASPAATCKQIDLAISANEDFVEAVLRKDAKARPKAITASFKVISSALSSQHQSDALQHIKLTEEQFNAGNAPFAALSAIENYKVLVTAFESRLPTSLDAAMLDYAGFKLRSLAAAKTVDWALVSATIAEAEANWTKAKGKMEDKAVIDLVDSIQASLTQAVIGQNAQWLDGVAQILLDSVDLVEAQVKNPAKGACS
jgi:hypothetical protein